MDQGSGQARPRHHPQRGRREAASGARHRLLRAYPAMEPGALRRLALEHGAVPGFVARGLKPAARWGDTQKWLFPLLFPWQLATRVPHSALPATQIAEDLPRHRILAEWLSKRSWDNPADREEQTAMFKS